jgi:hypothetical protein
MTWFATIPILLIILLFLSWIWDDYQRVGKKKHLACLFGFHSSPVWAELPEETARVFGGTKYLGCERCGTVLVIFPDHSPECTKGRLRT